ncbi:MAG: nitroreductase/quinone reductase family protein [Chloroflexi bacterium]|nr:nitroreductase/quinone reductase family protein [Chloroflexota bacterium]
MPTWKLLLIAWFFVPVHRLLFRLSGGRLLGRLEGTGVLILMTRGRRSGKTRSSPLLYFRFEQSGDLIVVASNYGRDRHPAWYLNVATDPRVSVEANGERFAANARVTLGEERTALYEKVVAANPRFATYYAATQREIPVVTLRRI